MSFLCHLLQDDCDCGGGGGGVSDGDREGGNHLKVGKCHSQNI